MELSSQQALICDECLENISTAIRFRNVSQTSDNYFRKLTFEFESDVLRKELDDTGIGIKSETEEDVKSEPIFCEPLYAAYDDSKDSLEQKPHLHYFQSSLDFKCDVKFKHIN